LLCAAGCGSSGGTAATAGGARSEAAPPEETSRPKEPSEAPTAAAPGSWASLRAAAGTAAERLLIPHGPPPEKVVVRQLRAGKGPGLKKGNGFRANYMSFDYLTGRRVEMDWEGESVLFHYLYGSTVKAWTAGLKGVRSGGLRELIAPSSWVYGNGPRVYLVKVTEIKR